MGLIKSKDELEKMRMSGKILAEIKQEVKDFVEPGMSTKQIDNFAHDLMLKKGVKPAFLGYGGFTGVLCISVNEEMIHGIPKKDKILKEGDLLKIDAGVVYKGYYSDSAFTMGVGKISEKDKELISVAKGAFEAGLRQIKKGARIGDISAAVGEYIKKRGFFTPNEFSGHGIGTALHEDPYVHNTGRKGTGPLLKDGMVICIEPMILRNSSKVKILKDGWTVVSKDGTRASHYEHTVAIINGKPEVLTKGM